MQKIYSSLMIVVGALLAQTASPAEWPDRPLQIIVPFSAGGTLDAVARRLGESLSAGLKQPVVIVNRDGASGTIGTTAVANGAPDGYTLGFVPNGPLTVQPALREVSYTLSSVRPICQVFEYSYVLAVHADNSVKSLKEFIDRAKASNKEMTYGCGGVATAPHFAMLELARVSGAKFLAVIYRGDPPVAMSVRAGEVDAAVLTVQVARAQGFKLLAIFSDKRLSSMPSVPTSREQGYEVLAVTHAGLIAPAKVTAEVAQKLESACVAATQSSEFRAAMQQMNQEVSYLPGEKFAAALAADAEAKRSLIESSGIKQEQ